MIKDLLGHYYNAKGQKFLDKNAYAQAEKAFLKSIKLAPNRQAPWYNLALIYKHTRKWEEALRCNQEAVKLSPRNEAAWWNLGIAATALGNWQEARRAWKSYRIGVPIPEGDDEFQLDLGPVPIRLNFENKHEVVWCKRIDPARAVIENVPTAKSRHRYKDVLLHDGEPKGSRTLGGRKIPVFDELQLLQPSAYSTYLAHAEITVQSELIDLFEHLLVHDIGSENWENDLRTLSDEESYGNAPPYQETEINSHNAIHLGLATKSEDNLKEILEQWNIEHPQCKVLLGNCIVKGVNPGSEARGSD
jgi:tetratricopeptide (TPR) repeat protein